MVYAVFMIGGSRFAEPRIEEWQAMHEFDKGLRSEPAFAVIEARHPKEVARALAEVRSGIRVALKSGDNGAMLDASRSAFKTLYGELLPNYARTIPDGEVVTFWRTWFKRYKTVAAHDSAAAFEALAGGHDVKVDGALNAELGNAGLRAIAAAISNPAPPPDSIEVEVTRRALIARLRTRFGDDVMVLADPLNPAFNRSRAQAVVFSFWDEIFMLPDREAGPLLRTLAPLENAFVANPN